MVIRSQFGRAARMFSDGPDADTTGFHMSQTSTTGTVSIATLAVPTGFRAAPPEFPVEPPFDWCGRWRRA
jgi:hypothetical protein